MISLDKKNLPSYLYKLNVALVCFFVLWFTLGLPLCVTIGCIYDESVITYAVMIATFATFFIGLAIFIAVDRALNNRVIKERSAELEKEFCEMSFEEAERILKERGVITDTGFVISKEAAVFEDEEVPFDNVWLDYSFRLSPKIDLKIIIYAKVDEHYGKYRTALDLDGAMYYFLINKYTHLKDNRLFALLQNDKKEFAKSVLKYSRVFHMEYTG